MPNISEISYTSRYSPAEELSYYSDTEDEDEYPRTFSRFPTSSVRDEPLPVPQPDGTHLPTLPRYDPLHILDQPNEHPTPSSPQTTWDIHVPRLYEIAPGVLDDGSLTVGHPAVKEYLSVVEEEGELPVPSSVEIFVLAALAVFYHPTKRAHWAFWCKDKKDETAGTIHRILNKKPTPITSPIAWMGIPENLQIIGTLQFAWRKFLEDEPWFAPFTDPKSAGKSQMVLRKRKSVPEKEDAEIDVVEEPLVESPVDPPVEPCAPPRKRPRTRKIIHKPKVSDEPKEGSSGLPSTSQSVEARSASPPSTVDSNSSGSSDSSTKRPPSARIKERKARSLPALSTNGRTRSISLSDATVVAEDSARSPPPSSDCSATTAVDVDDEKTIAVDDDEGDGKKVTPEPNGPGEAIRVSARIAKRKAQMEEREDKGEAVPLKKTRVSADKKERNVGARNPATRRRRSG